jgi:hypothetical protein
MNKSGNHSYIIITSISSSAAAGRYPSIADERLEEKRAAILVTQ